MPRSRFGKGCALYCSRGVVPAPVARKYAVPCKRLRCKHDRVIRWPASHYIIPEKARCSQASRSLRYFSVSGAAAFGVRRSVRVLGGLCARRLVVWCGVVWCGVWSVGGVHAARAAGRARCSWPRSRRHLFPRLPLLLLPFSRRSRLLSSPAEAAVTISATTRAPKPMANPMALAICKLELPW